jgi:hypothetical protein
MATTSEAQQRHAMSRNGYFLSPPALPRHSLAVIGVNCNAVQVSNKLSSIKNRSGPTATWRRHPFDRACHRHGIEHRLTKPHHPWTNGQVERMNRMLKEAAVQRYYYESHEQLRAHLADFLAAYNFAKRLKTLCGLTPHEYVCKIWTQKPGSLQARPNPSHHTCERAHKCEKSRTSSVLAAQCEHDTRRKCGIASEGNPGS